MNVIKFERKQRRVLERDIQAQIRACVNRLPFARVVRNNTGMLRDVRDVPVFYGLGEGSPDLVGAIRVHLVSRKPIGIAFGIEVKRPGKKPTPPQRAWHRFARLWGIHVIVADSAELAVSEVRRLHAGILTDLEASILPAA
jgi:hypothetical protein